jgi:hypothetical protein
MDEKPILGMDYGAPPRKMFLAGADFPSLWEKAKFNAIGWALVPPKGGGPPMPAIVLLFENAAAGIELFKVFKQWDTEPDSGRGLDLIFVHDPAARTYQVSFGPNWDEARRRMVAPGDDENYTVIMAGPTLGRTMPDTEGGVTWFRSESGKGPVLLVPAGPDRKPSWKHAIKKSDVQFFDKGAVPENLTWLTRERPAPEQRAAAFAGLAGDVGERRDRQMKRFFAVMVTRLESNRSFHTAVDGLTPPGDRKLCLQAACNLILLDRMRRTEGAAGDLMAAYKRLLETPEDIFDRTPSDREFTSAELADQIARDRGYLDAHIAPDSEPEEKKPTPEQL